MNTIFSFAPFRRFNLGTHALLSAGGAPRLSQATGGFFSDIGLSTTDLEGIIKNLPQEEQDFNRAQWSACVQKGLLTVEGAACAASVIAAAKTAAAAPRTATGARLPAAPSSFPVVPVLLGLAAAGGVGWFLVSKGMIKL